MACIHLSYKNFFHINIHYWLHIILPKMKVDESILDLQVASSQPKWFFFFRWASSNCIIHAAAFYTEQSTSPFVFSQLWSLTRWFKPVTEELWLHLGCHFLHFMHVHKALSSKMWLSLKDCWIRTTVACVHKDRESCSQHIHSLQKACEDRLTAPHSKYWPTHSFPMQWASLH